MLNIYSQQLPKYDSPYKNMLKVTPFKLLGITNPALEVTYERRTGKLFATQLMGSWLLPAGITDAGKSVKPHIKGFRFSAEEKIYYRKKKRINPYFAVEINYMWNTYRDIGYFGVANILDSSYHDTNYQDSFGVKKQTLSINTKWGFQFVVKRFCFDFFVGIGLRYKYVQHIDRLNYSDEMESSRHPNIYQFNNKAGKYWTVSIPLNVRIGYAF